MPNGTGKTTTLQLLKYALSGSAESESPAHIRSFKKRNSDVIHGIVEIKILHSNKKITY
jgi:ATPase subunit of ABC transporter with duplicated ATPase domains